MGGRMTEKSKKMPVSRALTWNRDGQGVSLSPDKAAENDGVFLEKSIEWLNQRDVADYAWARTGRCFYD